MFIPKKFWRDFFIALLPCMVVTTMLFIYILYPKMKIESGGYEEIEMIFRDSNNILFWGGCLMAILSSTLLATSSEVLYNAFRIYEMEPIKVSAKLISKSMHSQSVNTRGGFTSYYSKFQLIFELENKVKKKFYVTPDQFSLVFDGNEGILTYKEYSKTVYLDFDVLII